MAKEKKPLTIKEQRRKYKNYSRLLFASEYVSMALPYGIMAIVNREEWFVLNPEPWRIGLGGTLGLILMGLAMFLITKKKESGSQLTNGMISLLIIWYAVTFIFFLLSQVNMEIYKIMAYGGLGIMGALGLEVGSKNFDKKASELDVAMKKADENLRTEQATKEILDEQKKTKKQKQDKVVVD